MSRAEDCSRVFIGPKFGAMTTESLVWGIQLGLSTVFPVHIAYSWGIGPRSHEPQTGWNQGRMPLPPAVSHQRLPPTI